MSQFKDGACEMDDVDAMFRNDQVFFFLVRGGLVLNSLQVFKNNSKIIGKHGICRFTQKKLVFYSRQVLSGVIAQVPHGCAIKAALEDTSNYGDNGILFCFPVDEYVAISLRVPRE